MPSVGCVYINWPIALVELHNNFIIASDWPIALGGLHIASDWPVALGGL